MAVVRNAIRRGVTLLVIAAVVYVGVYTYNLSEETNSLFGEIDSLRKQQNVGTLLFEGDVLVVSSDAADSVKQAARAAKAVLGERIQICDGVSDQIEINKAIDTLPGSGGLVVLTAGGFNSDAPVEWTKDNVWLRGSGRGSTVLNFSKNTGTMVTNWNTSINVIGTEGGADETSKLTEDAVINDNSLSVADGSKFSAGDIIMVYSDEKWLGSETHLGEYQIVESVEGNVITLGSRLLDEYSVSENASARIDKMVRNPRISDLSVIGVDEDHQYGILFSRSRDVVLENVKVDKVKRSAIQLQYVYGGSLTNIITNHANQEGLGYGIAISSASRDISIDKHYAFDSRHAVTLGGSHGIPRFITITGSHYDKGIDIGGEAAIDTHLGQYINITGNTIKNYASGQGIDLKRSPNSLVVTNTISNCRTGILVRSSEVIIADNIIGPQSGESSGNNGISVPKFANSHGIILRGNVLFDLNSPAILIRTSGVSVLDNYVSTRSKNRFAFAVYVYTDGEAINDVRISGNHFDHSDEVYIEGSDEINNLIISNNSINSEHHGVFVRGTITDLSINDNYIESSWASGYGIYFYEDISLTRGIIRDNDLANSAGKIGFPDHFDTTTVEIAGNKGYK